MDKIYLDIEIFDSNCISVIRYLLLLLFNRLCKETFNIITVILKLNLYSLFSVSILNSSPHSLLY